jgi:hypothetical protein
MPDPLIGTALAETAADRTEVSAREVAPNLVMRVLGPTADRIGEAVQRWTAYRVGNVERIVKVAEHKSGSDKKNVHPRVAYEVFDRASFCHNELMAEYYSACWPLLERRTAVMIEQFHGLPQSPV